MEDFFQFDNLEHWAVKKKKEKVKANLPTPKIFALLRKTKVI